jgi:hypothetical protein
MRTAPLVLVILMAMPAYADDHLDPDTVAGTHAILRRAFEPDVRARVLVVPSFQQQFAVGIGEREGKYAIFSAVAAQHPRMKPVADPNAATLCEVPIPSSVAEDILGIWKAMLLETAKPQTRRFGMDGNFFHFAMAIDGQWLAGQTWSPPAESRTGALIGMVYAMKSYCETKDEAGRVQLERASSALLARMSVRP